MRINIIISHGLGKHKPDFWKKPAKKLIMALGEKNVNIVPFYWHNVIQKNQEDKMKHFRHLKYYKLRTFIIENVADAVTYRKSKIYRKIHNKLHNLLNDLKENPTVIIAPSLGGQIVLDHIWDSQEVGSEDHLKNLKLFITNGCNIALFSSGENPISHIRKDFRWLNYNDSADVLGYPLEKLGYGTEDIEIKPHCSLYSHVRYWHNKKFLDSIVKAIKKLI